MPMPTAPSVKLPPARTTVSSEILDRQPPCNLEAELGVVGSILLVPDVCDDVATILCADDFYGDAHRTLFGHMLAMHDAGRKIDLTLLVDELKKSDAFEQIGGVAYLATVTHSVPNAANAVYYAKIVRQKSTFRELIGAGTEILRDAYDEAVDSVELVSRAEERIFSVLDNRQSTSVQSIRKIMLESLDRIDERMSGEHTSVGVDTGFTELDALMGGLHNSELIILAARPSMGKTALALNIVEYVTLKSNIPTLLVSLEMSSMELADRLLSSVAKVDGARLRDGMVTTTDRQRLVEKAAYISEAPLFVDDAPNRTVTEIAAVARRIRRREGGLGFIVVDYLQLIQPDDAKDPRHEQVARMTRRLKGLAREMKVPVLCVAQLNRQTEDARDNQPRLSHLRESGAIEQDADVVMFVHRKEYFASEDEKDQFAGQAEVIIAKQRNGPVGKIDLAWKKQFTRFEKSDWRHRDEVDQYADGPEF